MSSSSFLNSGSTMTKTKVHSRKRVTVKLNSFTVKKMIRDIVKDVYGTTSYGQLRCSFDDTAVDSLQEAAESFLENMWEQLRHTSDNSVVTVRHVQLWKRENNFKLRLKRSNLSLCQLFKK